MKQRWSEFGEGSLHEDMGVCDDIDYGKAWKGEGVPAFEVQPPADANVDKSQSSTDPPLAAAQPVGAEFEGLIEDVAAVARPPRKERRKGEEEQAISTHPCGGSNRPVLLHTYAANGPDPDKLAKLTARGHPMQPRSTVGENFQDVQEALDELASQSACPLDTGPYAQTRTR